jgi:L-alanine-DL-glutamate epimerase-like enolase superfamily enzyme
VKIDEINIYKIVMPLSGDISHSLRKGAFANNVIVEVIADGGETRGYGEGAPREYVTGESQESVTKQVSRLAKKDSFPWVLNDVSHIWNFVDTLPDGKEHNSAICALEMSLLDALGKRNREYIITYFSQNFITSRIYYGAGVPLCNKTRKMEICRFIKKMKINKVKLKMGNDFAENQETIKIANSIFGDDCDLKIDINCTWDYDLALKHVHLIEEHKVKVVEQPLMPDNPDIAKFARIMQNSGIILMADESACSFRDIKKITREGYYNMINVRLSKCGGFRRSLRIIDHLRESGLYFQIGSHLGESGILSAAGRVLSLLCRDAAYYDGSYDRFMLKENITLEDVSFGPCGEAGPLDSPGLGVEINRESLMRLSNGSPSATISNPLHL